MLELKIESILEYLKKDLKKFRKKRYRIRRIFNILRKRKLYKGWSDLVLLNSIIVCLEELNLAFCKNEVYSAFKLVNVNDYYSIPKYIILRPLLKQASKYSVLKKVDN
ncbi:hypothetical protein HOE31_02905 [bacterium]|jgi:hypothetical protein|nr:hypothetical protein [bacterium]MBT4121873.1 hypothetical protein [bacterium]MBT4334894.1 hypothetical protein [bacterium]MBT4495845.1 hypothetical protein [bacterium]MBT4763722.1 hypothetical protein [bacterium]